MTQATLTADRPLSAAVTIPLIFRATVSEMIRRRILVFLGLICAIPLTLALVWRAFGMDFMDADQFFTNLVSSLYLQILVYVVGLAFGIPTVHSEVQGRTITYLFTRPIPRWQIYTAKLAAVQVTAGGLLALSLVGCFLVIVAGNGGAVSIEFLKAYMNHVVLVLVATVCITAVCSVFGTAFQKPVVWGMLYAFGWELVVSKFPGTLATYTINFHIRNLLLDDMDVQASLVGILNELLNRENTVSTTESTLALVAFLVVATALGAWVFRRREYVIN